MAKLVSLHGKTVTLITLVFIVSFSVLGLAFMSISASEERDKVRDLERSILLANSHVRDFIITRDPSDAKDTEFILQQADKLVEEGIRTKNYQRLHNEVLMYLHSIGNLIEIYQEQGFHANDGLEGHLNELSRRMEEQIGASDSKAMVAALAVSRHQKDFLLLGSETSVTGVHAGIDDLMSLVTKSKRSQEEMASLFQDMAEFQHSFDKLVSLRERMEWNRSQLSYFREAIGGTLAEVTAAEQVRARLYLWSALGLILFAFILGIAYAIRIARGVLNPLERLSELVRKVADGEDFDLELSDEAKNSGDLADIMTSFEEVSNQVKLRKAAEKDLQESKAAIQKYANELEARTKQLDLAVQNLGDAKHQAEQASKMKAEFLASMSHEIRTPLNGIIGMTSLLSVDELKADQKEVVDVIRTSGESLLGIVNHILDFSKIEAGAVVLENEPIDLADCLEDAISMVSRQAAEKGLDISFLVEEGTPQNLIGDGPRLKQVLVNLLGNAVKFTDDGEIHVSVSCLFTGTETAKLSFNVIDSGIGISPETLNSLFSPFIQAEASTNRRFGGTGLGLSISHGLVGLMGGNMFVESEVGKGSRFGFDITVGLGHQKESKQEPIFAGQQVLLLNESPLFGSALTAALTPFGLRVDQTESDEEAISLLQSNSYLAVLINEGKLGFDGVAGVAIAGMLCDVSPSMPIIVLRHINQQVLSGSTRCLLKPIKRSALKSILLRIADRTGSVVEVACEVEGAESRLKKLDRPPHRSNLTSVLLVEDNIVNQKVGMRMLQKLGCEVDVVDRGQKAVTAVQSGKYQIVFMDIQMPEMDGLEATQRIRELGDIVQPTIIALTANATTEDRTNCLNSGMDDYAAKPVNPKTLELLLTQWSPVSSNGNHSPEPV